MYKIAVSLFALVVFAAFRAVPAMAAVGIAEEERLCMAASAAGAWFPLREEKIRAYAEEFLRNTDVQASQVIVCTSEDRDAMLAWSRLVDHGFRKIFTVGMSRHFENAMREHARAIVAHEVAHQATMRSTGACKNYFLAFSREDYVLCEHDTDWVAASWVGRFAMLSALRETVRYFTQEAIEGPGFNDLKRRILLLETAP